MSSRGYYRTPKGYDGPGRTNRRISDLLPKLLRKIGEKKGSESEVICLAWSSLIGKGLAPQAKAERFEAGILYVRVQNSTLYALLKQRERPKLLRALQSKFPKAEIRNIVFKVG